MRRPDTDRSFRTADNLNRALLRREIWNLRQFVRGGQRRAR